MSSNNDLIHEGTDPSGSTTTHGAPAESDRNSLSLAPNGPLLLHDVHLVDTSVQVMPYEDAKTYRFNPFDLTKVWPHADYPLIPVGTMTLNENPENFFAQIEQAAFAPSSVVPGIGFSPDKMLLGRVFAYADAHRARIGTNFHQLPVNKPLNDESKPYVFDGNMTFDHAGSAPVYAPNSFGRPYADQEGPVEAGWEADGEMVRQAYSLHPEDDDWTQAGTLVRDVFDDAARDRFVDTVAGALAGVGKDVLERAFRYWRNVDTDIGDRIEAKVTADTDSTEEPTVSPPVVLEEPRRPVKG